jgi:hypothetical protein
VVIRWTPYDEPFISLAGIVKLDDLGEFTGIEADPVDGIVASGYAAAVASARRRPR